MEESIGRAKTQTPEFISGVRRRYSVAPVHSVSSVNNSCSGRISDNRRYREAAHAAECRERQDTHRCRDTRVCRPASWLHSPNGNLALSSSPIAFLVLGFVNAHPRSARERQRLTPSARNICLSLARKASQNYNSNHYAYDSWAGSNSLGYRSFIALIEGRLRRRDEDGAEDGARRDPDAVRCRSRSAGKCASLT